MLIKVFIPIMRSSEVQDPRGPSAYPRMQGNQHKNGKDRQVVSHKQ